MTLNDKICVPTRQDEFNQFWSYLLEEISDDIDNSIPAIVNDFLGTSYDVANLKLTSLHHVAKYVGEYEKDSDIDAFYTFLNVLQNSAVITALEIGPTYISPKLYGTPGWWFSFRINHTPVELFTCKYYGPWINKTGAERMQLMSHFGVSTANKENVYPILKKLETIAAHNEIIAYTEEDELGHTYGHLRNNQLSKVLEIVYSDNQEIRQPKL